MRSLDEYDQLEDGDATVSPVFDCHPRVVDQFKKLDGFSLPQVEDTDFFHRFGHLDRAEPE